MGLCFVECHLGVVSKGTQGETSHVLGSSILRQTHIRFVVLAFGTPSLIRPIGGWANRSDSI